MLEATVPETIVGLFGGTGHGKSKTFINDTMALLRDWLIGTTLNAMFPSIRLRTSDSNACTSRAIIIKGKDGEGANVEIIFLDEAEFKAERKVILEQLFAAREHGFSEEIGLQAANAKAKITALYPQLKIADFARTSDELETELSLLDGKHGIDQFIKDGKLNFFCHTANEFAEKTQKFGASAELEHEEAVVYWPIVKEMQ